MKFLADKAIPHVKEIFSHLGDVELLPASDINKDRLLDIDGLITRTTTQINSELLEGTKVKFVGTATIGTDHIDIPYLKQKGIEFSSAPGCNATAVGEFVLNAIIRYAREKNISLRNHIVGIIGAGNTGNALKDKVEKIGLSTLFYDPLVEKKKNENSSFVSFHELIRKSTIISIHVPLTRNGPYPTFHLINDDFFNRINPETILINTSRGEVINDTSLLKNRDRFKGLILDVWNHEPNINANILETVDIATPHIAGYSVEGKIRGTEMIYHAAHNLFQNQSKWEPSVISKIVTQKTIIVENAIDYLSMVLDKVYDIKQDDRSVRELFNSKNPGSGFADLRNQYRFRNEFSAFNIKSNFLLNENKRRILSDLGFKIEI